MKLFVDAQYLSPYAMSAFVCLREKELPFQMVLIDLDQQEHLSPDYTGLFKTARVPGLCDGDFHLSESSAIAEYLEDSFPGVALYPANRQAKARARQLQAWLRSDLLPIRQERSTEIVFRKGEAPALSPEAQRSAAKLFALAQSLLPAGADTLFDGWSIADTDLALMLMRLIRAGDSVPPALAAYARAQWLRPSVQEWVQLRRPGGL